MRVALLLLLAAAAGTDAAYVPGSDRDATIIKNVFEQAIDESFVHEMETSNGIEVQMAGESLPGRRPETGKWLMSGSYSYSTPNGQRYTVTWEADERGYRVL